MYDKKNHNKKVDTEDLTSSYLVNKDKKMLINNIQSTDIKESEDGNCTLNGKNIEANACSMLKEDYKI